MSGFLLALIACLLAATGGRDQRMVAGLSASLGRSGALLAASWGAAIATAALAAAFGAVIAQLFDPLMIKAIVALAFLIAAIDLAWPFLWTEPKEPTRSLFAIALVIASRQVFDAARFILVALAAASDPLLAGLGGAIGGGLALSLGWALASRLPARLPLRAIRLVIAGLLLAAAIWTGLSPRGIL